MDTDIFTAINEIIITDTSEKKISTDSTDLKEISIQDISNLDQFSNKKCNSSFFLTKCVITLFIIILLIFIIKILL